MTRFHWLLCGAVVALLLIVVLCGGTTRWLLLGLVCGLTGSSIALGSCYPNWQLFGESLSRTRITRRAIILTFDDGPDPDTTPALLDLLAKRGVRATFFCVGSRVAQHPELVRRMANEGHEVENHSYLHSHWTNLFSAERLRADLTRAQHEIHTVTARNPGFFRPPMTLTNPRIFQVARQLGLQVVGYTSRGLDRRSASALQIAARLLRCLEPGAILMLHDGGVPTDRLLEVVTIVIDRIEAGGYKFLRLDEAIPAEVGKPLN